MEQSHHHSRTADAALPELRIGLLDMLPNIVLPNQQAEVINLMEFMAGGMLVLLVVRDPREPASMTQLRRFAENWEALQRRANLFVVASTPPEVNARLPDGPFPFYLLSDPKGELARIVASP